MEKKTSKLLMEYKKFYLLIIVPLFYRNIRSERYGED